MNRRGFFAALAAGAAAAVIAPFVRVTPVLRGDGVHDDSTALQAWADGYLVRRPDGSVQSPGELIGGTYLITKTLVLGKSDRPIRLENLQIEWGGA